jgi:hypothetical protein
MAVINIGDAATAGLRLIVKRPVSVLVWGLLSAAYVSLILVIFGGSLITGFMTLARGPVSGPPPAQVLGLVAGAFGAMLLLMLGLILISAMIQGAALRAELEPENRGFAYLRLGRQELWLIAVNFVLSIVVGVAQAVMMIPVMIITVSLGAAGMGLPGGAPGDFSGPLGLGFVIPLVGQLIVALAALWIWLRLCMGPVMSFHEREFRLFESWTLTKGQAGRIFAVMFLVGLMLLALEIVFSIIGMAGVGVTVLANSGLQNVESLRTLTPAAVIAKLIPLLALFALMMVFGVGIINALIWGAVARMYRQLHPDADIATTFA